MEIDERKLFSLIALACLAVEKRREKGNIR
jgi:hypothetical protein